MKCLLFKKYNGMFEMIQWNDTVNDKCSKYENIYDLCEKGKVYQLIYISYKLHFLLFFKVSFIQARSINCNINIFL